MEAPREGNGERNAVKVARCVRRGEHAPAHEVGRFLPYLVGVTPHQGARESRAQGEVVQVVACPAPVRYKPRHGFLYIYAECSRLCPESSPKALLEPRTEGGGRQS